MKVNISCRRDFHSSSGYDSFEFVSPYYTAPVTVMVSSEPGSNSLFECIVIFSYDHSRVKYVFPVSLYMRKRILTARVCLLLKLLRRIRRTVPRTVIS